MDGLIKKRTPSDRLDQDFIHALQKVRSGIAEVSVKLGDLHEPCSREARQQLLGR